MSSGCICIVYNLKSQTSKFDRHSKGYKILQGVRGQEGVNLDLYADQVARVSALVQAAPEIAEMDLNPLLGNPRYVTAVDARIRIEK